MSIVRCECGVILVPMGAVWYHPPTKCELGYGKLFSVEVTILDQGLYGRFAEEYGTPTQQTHEIIESLLFAQKPTKFQRLLEKGKSILWRR